MKLVLKADHLSQNRGFIDLPEFYRILRFQKRQVVNIRAQSGMLL